MSDERHDFDGDERLLTFAVGATIYALPIAAVHEVAETKRVACVPGLPVEQGGVMNWSGEALPILANQLLLRPDSSDGDEMGEIPDSGGEAADAAAPGIAGEHVLVVAERAEAPARLGLPVDRVVGLVSGGPLAPRNQGLVQERRPIDGRVVHVLDPKELVARAERIVARVEGVAA
jgi:chemotaxis signal transduction protein